MIDNPWECPQCHSWVNGNESHLCIFPKETFPRPPSNEQTLLTELGQVKVELDEVKGWKDIAEEQLRRVVAERDALAVTAERLREELAKWKPLTPEEAQKAFDEAKAEPLSDERIAEILRHATDPAYTMPNSEQAQLAVTAERQAEQIKRLRESLTNCVDFIGHRKNVYIDAAAALLKETAP